MPPNRNPGQIAEKLAQKLLQSNGLHFLEANYSTKLGEIDLIFRDRDTIVFVEVKYRRSTQLGHPYEAVNPKKIQKIIRTGRQYLIEHYPQHPFRLDIVSINGDLDHPHIRHIENITV